jgi:hypothetical protein
LDGSPEASPDPPTKRPVGYQPSPEERRVRQKLWEAVDAHFGKFPVPMRETREANAVAELAYQIEVLKLFNLQDALACFEEKRGEVWRTSPVSMFTIHREISQWLHTREANERDGSQATGAGRRAGHDERPSRGRYASSAERSEERLRERDYEKSGERIAARIAARAASGCSRFDPDF